MELGHNTNIRLLFQQAVGEEENSHSFYVKKALLSVWEASIPLVSCVPVF